MDPKFQPSFIPRRPVVPGGMAAVVQKQPPSILGIASTVILIVVIGLCAVAFFYERTLVSKNEEKRQQIKAEIDLLDPELTNELSLLKVRIDTAITLLAHHTALTDFFSMLQKNTISTIQFVDFKYDMDGKNGPAITMKGVSNGFNDLVLQSDVFLANTELKDVIFSGYQLDAEGMVSFVVDALLDPELIAYQKKPVMPMEAETTETQTTETEESTNTTSSETSTSTGTTTPPTPPTP